MEQKHTSKQFELDLQYLQSCTLHMGGLVEEQLANALEAISTGKDGLANSAMEVEYRINGIELSISQKCCHIIARRQPTASDLRFIMTVLKIITDLERMGTEASKIARMAKQAYESDGLCMPRFSEIYGIGQQVIEMLRTTLDAFARLVPDIAIQITLEDKQINDAFRSTIEKITSYMTDDPRTISAGLDILFVAKSLEIIGDHVKNIADHLVYMVKGKDVRHASLDSVQLALQN
jgi:phosphate transport system protein